MLGISTLEAATMILIIGGYGQVGARVSKRLANVIVAVG